MAECFSVHDDAQSILSSSRLIKVPLAGFLIAADAVMIVASAVIAVGLYDRFTSGVFALHEASIYTGALAACSFVVTQLTQHGYDLRKVQSGWRGVRQVIFSWNLALLFVLLIGFFTKHTGEYARSSLLLFYPLTLLSLVASRIVASRMLVRGIQEGWISVRRVVMIGTPDKIAEFRKDYDPSRTGFAVVAFATLDDISALSAEEFARQPGVAQVLHSAVSAARENKADDIYLMLPWSNLAAIEACTLAVSVVPAAVHLGPESVLHQFRDPQIAWSGPVPSLRLARAPLGWADMYAKRFLDVAISLFALILLSPLMLVIACLIKLESAGPVLFRQRRYGYNQDGFNILKFRTMRAMEDGPNVRQAQRNDPRVTFVGKFLRASSLDELPQLWNVLKGDMSLVGPRPHAVCHNVEYEAKIALYARRHSVKPGITGWAQVHGLRGETDTDEKMRARVAYDLQYIDNWSLSLDALILLRTVFSSQTFTNSY